MGAGWLENLSQDDELACQSLELGHAPSTLSRAKSTSPLHLLQKTQVEDEERLGERLLKPCFNGHLPSTNPTRPRCSWCLAGMEQDCKASLEAGLMAQAGWESGASDPIRASFCSWATLRPKSDRLILGVQLSLFLSTVVFVVLTSIKQVAMPNSWALFMRHSARVSILLITSLSTLLSLLCSYLFSRAMIRLLQSQLSHPTSLIRLTATLEISRKKPIINSHFWGYTGLTFIFMLFSQLLTACFATLLTPTSIIVHSPMTGVEVDFSSSMLNQALNSSKLYNQTVATLGSNQPNALGPLLVSSGMASAYSRFGFPTLLKFNSAIFNSSTGGVLPVGLNDIQDRSRVFSVDLQPVEMVPSPLPRAPPSRYQVSGQAHHLGDGFSSNHTIVQQGFTADVKCQQRSVSEPNRPSILPSPQGIFFPGANATNRLNYTLFKWTFEARCPDGRVLDVSSLLDAIGTQYYNSGIVLVTLCPDQDLSGRQSPGNHLLSVLGAGPNYSYLDSTVCEVKTKVTLVQVEYQRSISISKILSTEQMGSRNSHVSFVVMSIINSMISQSQTLYTSGFGDVIRSMYEAASAQALDRVYFVPGNGSDHARMNELLEVYLKGQVEFLGSYIRAALSVDDRFSNNELPLAMRRDVTGRWYSETMGWDHSQRKVDGVTLIPIVLIVFSSIAAIHWPHSGQNNEISPNEGKSKGKAERDFEDFNPDNLVELLVATSVGCEENGLNKESGLQSAMHGSPGTATELIGPLDRVKLIKHPTRPLWALQID